MSWSTDYAFEIVRFWAGYTDDEVEGVYKNVNTGKTITKNSTYWPFYPGKPNGGSTENCAVVNVPREAWNDIKCSMKLTGFCRLPIRKRFLMRGERH